MSDKYFNIEENNGAIFIVNNTSCHIDGEPFKYEQVDKYDASLLCEELNDLTQAKIDLQEIMNIIHNIKYNNWEWQDLDDYIYKGISLDELYNKHDRW